MPLTVARRLLAARGIDGCYGNSSFKDTRRRSRRDCGDAALAHYQPYLAWSAAAADRTASFSRAPAADAVDMRSPALGPTG